MSCHLFQVWLCLVNKLNCPELSVPSWVSITTMADFKTHFRVQATNSQSGDFDFLQVLHSLITEFMTATCLTFRSLLYETIPWVDENKGNPVKKEEMPSVLKAQIFNPFVFTLKVTDNWDQSNLVMRLSISGIIFSRAAPEWSLFSLLVQGLETEVGWIIAVFLGFLLNQLQHFNCPLKC